MSPVLRLIKDNGIVANSNGAIPDSLSGHRTDDAGRALGLAAMLPSDLASAEIAEHCLAQLQRSLVSPGHFAARLDQRGNPREDIDNDDATARALWGLSLAATSALPISSRDWSADLLRLFRSFQSPIPQAAAHAVIAGSTLLKSDEHQSLGEDLLLRNIEHMPHGGLSSSWVWPQGCLSSGNGILAESLLHAGKAMGNMKLVSDGLDQLGWLLKRETAPKGHFSFNPVGSNASTEVSVSEQRPLEAWTAASACAIAHSIDPDRLWSDAVFRAADWFAGANDRSIPMWDHENGAAFDALTATGVNENQSAEATLAFIGTLIERDRMNACLRSQPIRLLWPRVS